MPVQGIERNSCLQCRKAVQKNKYNLIPSCIDPYQISWPQQQEEEAIKNSVSVQLGHVIVQDAGVQRSTKTCSRCMYEISVGPI